MAHTTPNTWALQSLLFSSGSLTSCLFRQPSARELEFLQFFSTVQSLLCFVKYVYNKKSPKFQFLISWKSTI